MPPQVALSSFQIFHDGGHAFTCSVPPSSATSAMAVADMRLMSGDTKVLARSQDGSVHTWNLADGKMASLILFSVLLNMNHTADILHTLPFFKQISHYEQKTSTAFPLPHAHDGDPITSWDVSPSCDFVALVRSGGAVSLLSVSPRGSINHTRKSRQRFNRFTFITTHTHSMSNFFIHL